MKEEDFLDFPARSQETVVVAQYFSLSQAEIASAALRDANISCFIANSGGVTTFGVGQNAVRLHADYRRADEAKQIIEGLVFDDAQPGEKSSNLMYWLVGILLLIIAFMGYLTFARS
jgi:hypothetical protein